MINQKQPKAKTHLASIIIPCWNQVEYTQLCLESVFRYGGSKYELIIIDNGSTDETAVYLSKIQDTSPVPVTVITNKENRGFPAAINQGLQIAKGEYLVLLNNDTVVTEGWLGRLMAVAKLKPQKGHLPIGLVGPMSNYASPPQLIEDVRYNDLDAMHVFASEWKQQHQSKWFPSAKLSGFCLMMTRAVYKAVGGLDERFGMGMFDDDDLALRAKKAGFELAVAEDVFIHHFGSRTFAGQNIDSNAVLKKNMAQFQAKWGKEAPPMQIVTIKPFEGESPLSTRQRKIIDAFTFYQEYEMLDFRLKLLYPHVDKIVIVEADKTFSGLDKPFYYELAKERYAWAADKIVYFKLHCDISKLNLKTPPTEYQPNHDCWQIEYAQRGAIIAACKDFADDDLLIMGDVDEIPSLEALTWAKQNASQLPAVCQQHFFYYDLKHLTQEEWCGSIISPLHIARIRGTQDLRNHRNVLTRLGNGGWHLSYFSDAEGIIQKIESFSHQELNVPEFKDKKHIDQCRLQGNDLFKRAINAVKTPPEFFPSYFRNAAPENWWGVDSPDSKMAKHSGKNKKTRNKAKVSLTMIVRNEEQNLPRCLESVRGVFDEIVIVDTGSTDCTKEIAAKFGAHIVDFTWIDDFAAARNVALEHATGDYAFWLDADDVIEPPHKEKLRDLLKQLRPDSRDAYVLRCICDTSAGGHLVVDHPRLFPLQDGIRWSRRIHEVINPALDQAGIATLWTDIEIRHMGYLDPVIHEKKRQRNHILLQKELAERPDDPFIYYYLGTLAFERDKWQQALGYYILSLAKWGTSQSIACKLFAMIAWTNQILQRYDESVRVCNEGLHYFPNDGELWFRKAVALRYLHRRDEAETCWKQVLKLGRPKTFYSVDEGIYGHLTRHNLALIAEEKGDEVEAKLHWRAILEECPGHAEALRRMKLEVA